MMRSGVLKSKIITILAFALLLLGVAQPSAQATAPGLIPTFSTPVSTSTGFTVQITNYDAAYFWVGTATSGTAVISGSGLVTFTGPANATVTITTTKSGNNNGSQTIGLCVGTAPISVSTSSQNLVAGDSLVVTFNRVGKFCSSGNFKMIQANSTAVNGQGFLDDGARTTTLTLNSFPNRAGTQTQTVTYTKAVTNADELQFFQFYFVSSAGAVTKTTGIVAVYPGNYNEPQNGNLTVSIGAGYQLPYYFSNLTGMEPAQKGTNYFGDLSYYYWWYNCGAPSSDTGIAALSDPTTADASCQAIDSGGYSFIRGDLTATGPTNITNSVLVSKVMVTDVFGNGSPFYSAAITTPTFAVTSVSPSSVYVGGGDVITVTGAGLTDATVIWTPNAGNSTLITTLTNASDTQFDFAVPAPTNRAATSATISIRPAGGFIAGPSSIALTKASVASLSDLSFSSLSGSLSPTFSSGTTRYSASVDAGTTSLTVTPTFSGTGQTVTVNGTSISSGVASRAISLSQGDNIITVIGTAENGDTKTYTITVNRPTPPTLATPSLTAAATTGRSDSISLSWGAISHRSTYTVKIYTAASGTPLLTIDSLTGTTLAITAANFPDIGVKALYKFSVTAVGDSSNYLTSAESTKVAAATGSVTTTSVGIGSASAFEGRSVSAVISEIPSGGSYAYQWFGGSDTSTLTSIPSNSTSSSYTPTASDRSYSAQMYLAVKVVATISGITYSFTSSAIPVYTYPNATGGSVTADTSGTYNGGKYKVGQTVIGHPWQIMGTPWPKMSYQWYICATPSALANPGTSCSKAPGQDLNDIAHGFSDTALNCEGQLTASVPFSTSGSYGVCTLVTSGGNTYIAVRPSYPAVNAHGPDGSYWSVFNALSHGISTHVGGSSGTDLGNPYDLGNYNFSYVVPTEALGHYLTFTETLTNAATDQNATPFTLTQTRVLSSGVIQPSPPTGTSISLDSNHKIGQVVTATATGTTGYPASYTYTYSWYRCTAATAGSCSIISTGSVTSSTTATYTIQSADNLKYIQARVVASNAWGTAPAVSSARSSQIVLYALGDTALGGGTVFYYQEEAFSEAGAKCGSNCHYLEFAPSTWTNNQGNGDFNTAIYRTGELSGPGTSSELGEGFANTRRLDDSNSYYAPKYARNYAANDNSRGQWFIGSNAEATLLANYVSTLNVGGFQNGYYLSSTIRDVRYANQYNFTTGNVITNQTISEIGPNTNWLRPIRAL